MQDNYNLNCSTQFKLVFENLKLNKDLIIKSIQQNIKSNKDSIKILDIGCSHGYNSCLHLNFIISIIRDEMKCDKLIQVYHNDQEKNDFTKLFQLLNNDTSGISYLKNYQNIYSYAIGSSFMNQLVPNESMDIIFSFYTLHWGDENSSIHQHKDLFPITKDTTPEFDQYVFERLYQIVLMRSKELSIGGCFIFNVCAGETEDQLEITQNGFKGIKDVLREMANDGILSHQEVNETTLPLIFYRKNIIDKVLDNCNESFKLNCDVQKYLLLDWGTHAKSTITTTGDAFTTQYAINFVNNHLGYQGPYIKKSIQGSQDKVNDIYNQFYNRLIQKVQNTNYNITNDINFIILSKIK